MPDFAPGTQKNVSGEVIRWNDFSGAERIDAKKYIELLEAEVEELNRQVGRKSENGQNELLEFLKSLEPQNLKVMKPAVLLYVILLGKLHFLHFNYWVHLNSPSIYKTKQCAPLCIENMQIASTV